VWNLKSCFIIPTFIVSCAGSLQEHRERRWMGGPTRDCCNCKCIKRCYSSLQGGWHFFDQGRLPGTIVACTMPKGKYLDLYIDSIVLIFALLQFKHDRPSIRLCFFLNEQTELYGRNLGCKIAFGRTCSSNFLPRT
jgi:hypothetical protein